MTEITSIRVDYKNVDGWHVFSSEKIAGLYVASQNAEEAYNDVCTALEKLLELNEGIQCTVKPEIPFSEFVRMRRGERAPERPVPAMSTQRYAVYACA